MIGVVGFLLVVIEIFFVKYLVNFMFCIFSFMFVGVIGIMEVWGCYILVLKGCVLFLYLIGYIVVFIRRVFVWEKVDGVGVVEVDFFGV